MTLYFLRHGIAVDATAWSGTDFERPLTPEGKKRMAREAKTMRALALDLEAVVSSPLVRAKQTAEIVVTELGLPRAVEDERVGLDFDLERLAQILAARRTAQSLLLVGHEPTMSDVIGRVIGAASVDMKKGSLARVDVFDTSRPRGTLIWLLPPKVLAL